MSRSQRSSTSIFALLLAPRAAFASEGIDSGDTAWILTSTALVLFMTIPGLALFYGGLVRTKNVLSVLMQCFALTAMVTVLWLIFGYSLAFDSTGMQAGVTGLHSFIGSFAKSFLRGVDGSTPSGSIPEVLFFCFQMTFAIITPALIVGTFAERMKFSAMLAFSAVWLILVYTPICHMTWGGEGSFFGDLGVFDFAGGIVVHITAGVAALVACIVIGPRRGYPVTAMPPHNMTMCVTGTGMLWVGWYGFNGGSALTSSGDAAMAVAVTQISAATAALTWMGIEWVRHGTPSALGLATGAIAGLAAVTPASGFIGPVDVFGVHGVGGFVGTVLAGIFAAGAFGGNQGDLAIGRQLGVQLGAAGFTVVYTAIVSWGILKAVDAALGLRVDETSESRGLDLTLHNETGYNL
jgi:Amt family ammonium transporter